VRPPQTKVHICHTEQQRDAVGAYNVAAGKLELNKLSKTRRVVVSDSLRVSKGFQDGIGLQHAIYDISVPTALLFGCGGRQELQHYLCRFYTTATTEVRASSIQARQNYTGVLPVLPAPLSPLTRMDWSFSVRTMA
jgi:hypothetical protein